MEKDKISTKTNNSDKKQSQQRQAKADAREHYQLLKEINKEIQERAKAYGIEVNTQRSIDGGPADSEKGRAMNNIRNDKVLQAIHTLLEDNILALVLKGILIALTDDTTVGKDMIKYWCDKYLPPVEAHKAWDKGETSNSITHIQQAIQLKMILDTQGHTIEELPRLLAKLAPTE